MKEQKTSRQTGHAKMNTRVRWTIATSILFIGLGCYFFAEPGRKVDAQGAPAGPGRLLIKQGSILAYNKDGSNSFNVTYADTSGYSFNWPSVSPQTGMIAFAARGEAVTGYRVFVMNGDGSGFRQVTFQDGLQDPNNQMDVSPVISPDGTKIAFLSTRNNLVVKPGQFAQPELYVINTNGTGLRQVTPKVVQSDQFGNLSDSSVSSAAWSPDGSQFLVRGSRPNPKKPDRFGNNLGQLDEVLEKINLDGTSEQILTDGTPSHQVSNFELAGLFLGAAMDWSPGGTILYTVGNGPATYEAYNILGGGSLTDSQLGGLCTSERCVRFSPAGGQILFRGSSKVKIVNLDGTNQQIVADFGRNPDENAPLWWAAGSAIPKPDHLTLTPNPVVVSDTHSQLLTPTLFDAAGNVIFQAAATYNFTSGTGDCTGCIKPTITQLPSGPRVIASGNVGIATLCASNAGLTGCTTLGNNYQSVSVGATQSTTPTSGKGGPGVFAITRVGGGSTSSIAVNFALSGSAVRDVDYSLDISGNGIAMGAGQVSVNINVRPTGKSAGKGDKTVILTLQPDASNTFLVDGTANAATVTIKDDGPPPVTLSLSSIVPNKGGDSGPITTTIYGAKIATGATVKLSRSGQADIIGTGVSVAANGASLTSVFDLTGKARGTWDVVVTNPDNTSAMLAAAFTIEASRGAQIWVDVIGRYTVRGNLTQTFYLAYGNNGDVDAPATFLRLSVPASMMLTNPPLIEDSYPNISINQQGTTLEYFLPKISANSSSFAPVQITSSVDLIHETRQITVFAVSTPAYQDLIPVPIVPPVTPTIQVMDQSDDHVKINVHMTSADGTGDLLYDTRLFAASGPSMPTVTTTQTSTDMQITITGMVTLTSPAAKSVSVPDGPPQQKGFITTITGNFIDWQVARRMAAQAEEEKQSKDEARRVPLQVRVIECLRHKKILSDQQISDLLGLGDAKKATEIFGKLDSIGGALHLVQYAPIVGELIHALGTLDGLLDGGFWTKLRVQVHSGIDLVNNRDQATADLFIAAGITNDGDHAFIKALLRFCRCRYVTSGFKVELKTDTVEVCPTDPPLIIDRQVNVTVVVSGDPNEKEGSQGAGPQHFVSGAEPLRYAVSFENVATATAPAQTVVITDQLDTSNLDLSTFSIGAFGFGKTQVAVPPGLSTYTSDVDLRPAKNLIVRIRAQLDKNTGLLTWRFTSIDPATGQPTTDPLAGFLPPNKTSPEGQGSVVFSVMPKPNLATGTEIRNQARIVFDTNAPIDTPQWLNTIDNSLPASHAMPLDSVQSSIVFNVNWTGTDTGSGIQSYDVFVSENGGAFTLWQSNTPLESGTFVGRPGKSYAFYTEARDGAGNLEPAKSSAEVLTTAPSTNLNAIDDTRFFIRQHYLDFLGREPDSSGWDFWTNNIASCGSNTLCRENKRIDTSAAYFLSIEFQQTGYLVEKMYKAAYGSANGSSTFGGTHILQVPIVRFEELLPDTLEIAQGVIVGQGNWQQQIETNKQAFTSEFVQRPRFATAFPNSMTAAQFVDTLRANAGNPLSPSERDQLVNDLSTNVKTRAQVLRAIAENPVLNTAESNHAFVLMQYFGYLRRNPNDAPDSDYSGYDFWLTKLSQFNGNFQNAEMVKAFISATEYRQRFGP